MRESWNSGVLNRRNTLKRRDSMQRCIAVLHRKADAESLIPQGRTASGTARQSKDQARFGIKSLRISIWRREGDSRAARFTNPWIYSGYPLKSPCSRVLAAPAFKPPYAANSARYTAFPPKSIAGIAGAGLNPGRAYEPVRHVLAVRSRNSPPMGFPARRKV